MLKYYYIMLIFSCAFSFMIIYCTQTCNNYIHDNNKMQHEKLKNYTAYQKKLKIEKELRDWVMDETWQ